MASRVATKAGSVSPVCRPLFRGCCWVSPCLSPPRPGLGPRCVGRARHVPCGSPAGSRDPSQERGRSFLAARQAPAPRGQPPGTPLAARTPRAAFRGTEGGTHLHRTGCLSSPRRSVPRYARPVAPASPPAWSRSCVTPALLCSPFLPPGARGPPSASSPLAAHSVCFIFIWKPSSGRSALSVRASALVCSGSETGGGSGSLAPAGACGPGSLSPEGVASLVGRQWPRAGLSGEALHGRLPPVLAQRGPLSVRTTISCCRRPQATRGPPPWPELTLHPEAHRAKPLPAHPEETQGAGPAGGAHRPSQRPLRGAIC